MMGDFFNKMDELMNIYKSGKNKGKKEIWSHHAKDSNVPCGDTVEVFMDVEGDIIKDASFEGQGCLVSQVSASLLLDYIKGKNVGDILLMDDEIVKSLIGIDLSPTRMRCATLVLRVVKAALSKKYIMNVYSSEKGDIVSVVDHNIIGKTFEEDDKVLDLSSPFYNGKKASFKEIVEKLKGCFTANIVGNNIVDDLIDYGLIHKENVKKIKGIKYIHMYKLE